MTDRPAPCAWVASDQPRVVKGRHEETCPEEGCTGCQPCTEAHCYGDACRGANHTEAICARCLTAARDDLAAIRIMCGLPLLEEVLSNGTGSEAAMLLGPAANPEAWSNRAMSAMMGRVDAGYLDDCRDEAHPLWVLSTWEQVYRDHFDQPSDLRQTIARAGDYLSRQMHLMTELLEPPFDEFAKGLRQCRAHLEDVLRDGEQRDTGAPCMTCEIPLVMIYGAEEKRDLWRCPRCRETSTPEQYLFAVQHHHREVAKALTADDLALKLGIKASIIRVWGSRGTIAKRGRNAEGITLYDVEDVEARHAGVQESA